MDLGALRPGGRGQGADDIVKDSSTAGFAKDVLDASRDALVIVDFWAAWCGPCKQLTPILEKAVRAAGGDLGAAGLSLAEMGGLKGRGARHRISVRGGQALLIDESYNANPASMRATLAQLNDHGAWVATPITSPSARNSTRSMLRPASTTGSATSSIEAGAR